MDTNTLVEHLLTDGQKLIEELLRSGFEVTAAFLLKKMSNEKWYFYIVSPTVDDAGLVKASRLLREVLAQIPLPFRINFFRTILIEPDDPIAKDVLNVLHRLSRTPVGPSNGLSRWLAICSLKKSILSSANRFRKTT